MESTDKNVPLVQFLNRVVTSSERVQFTDIDPYGHLNASCYAALAINHRISALENQIGLVTMDIAKVLGVGFYIAKMEISYISPAFLNEELEIASWVSEIGSNSFVIYIVISGVKNQKVKAVVIQNIRTVDVKTGQAVNCPESLPTRGDAESISSRPTKAEYVSRLKNYRD